MVKKARKEVTLEPWRVFLCLKCSCTGKAIMQWR